MIHDTTKSVRSPDKQKAETEPGPALSSPPVLPQWEPVLGEEEVREIVAAVRSSWITEAERTRQLEAALAQFFGVEHAVLTNNGTAAIALALMAAGVGLGDEVIVPDFTFIATANAVRLAGARPVLVDVRSTDITLDPDQVEGAITPNTKALLPVHLNGRAADTVRLGEIARRHGLALIVDAAQALGSKWQGRYLGTDADIGCFSLATTKIITTGQGGFLLTNNGDLKNRLVELKDQGRLQRSWNHHPTLGFNFKFTDLQAAIGLAQLTKLEDRLRRMKGIYSAYRECLSGLEEVRFLPMKTEEGASPWFVDIFVDQPRELGRYLSTRGIQTRPFYPPIHTQGVYRQQRSYPNATRFSTTGLWLPSSLSLTDEDIERVVSAVHEFYTGAGGSQSTPITCDRYAEV